MIIAPETPKQKQQEEEALDMLRKKGLKPETMEALRAALGGDDGAKVTIDPETGKIAIKDGKIDLELSVPDILNKQEVPPKTRS